MEIKNMVDKTDIINYPIDENKHFTDQTVNIEKQGSLLHQSEDY